MDNFGFSAGNAQLFYEMGFKVLYMSRVDWVDKQARNKRDAIEFVWAAKIKERECPLLVHILHSYYMQPGTFWFDMTVKDSENHEPIRDIEHGLINVESNILERSEQMVGYFRKQAEVYSSKEVLHLIGNEYSLSSNGQCFDNWDRLYNHINAKHNRYSMLIRNVQPLDYFHALLERERDYELKRTDFLPFRNGKGEFWSGYYSSRPNFKLICKTFT